MAGRRDIGLGRSLSSSLTFRRDSGTFCVVPPFTGLRYYSHVSCGKERAAGANVRNYWYHFNMSMNFEIRRQQSL